MGVPFGQENHCDQCQVADSAWSTTGRLVPPFASQLLPKSYEQDSGWNFELPRNVRRGKCVDASARHELST